jgi:hypothetical protein
MTAVAYYLPNIPDNPSTARYNHAVAIPDVADQAALITYPHEPPVAISSRYDSVRVLESEGIRRRASEATRFAEGFLSGSGDGDAIYLTTFHYAPALSG